MLSPSRHWHGDKLGHSLDQSAPTGIPEGARNVSFANSEYPTNVTFRCFPVPSNVTLAIGNVTLMSIRVDFNVTLAARNVTSHLSGQKYQT